MIWPTKNKLITTILTPDRTEVDLSDIYVCTVEHSYSRVSDWPWSCWSRLLSFLTCYISQITYIANEMGA